MTMSEISRCGNLFEDWFYAYPQFTESRKDGERRYVESCFRGDSLRLHPSAWHGCNASALPPRSRPCFPSPDRFRRVSSIQMTPRVLPVWRSRLYCPGKRYCLLRIWHSLTANTLQQIQRRNSHLSDSKYQFTYDIQDQSCCV